jgi:hypothetical protein
VLDHRVGAGLALGVARAVALGRADLGEVPQPGGLGVAGGHRVRRQLGGDELEVEGALLGDLEAGGEQPRVAAVHVRHLLRRADVLRGGRQPPVELVEAAAGVHGGQGVGERLVPGRGAVDVPGGDRRDPGRVREIDQHLAAGGIERQPPVGDLDDHVLPAERLDQQLQLGARCGDVPGARSRLQRAAHGTLTAAGEHGPVTFGVLGQLIEAIVRLALATGGEVRGRDGAREPPVALRTPGEHEQVLLAHGELGAEDAGQPEAAGSLREAHDAVEPVVVRQRQPGQPAPHGLHHQLLGLARSVEEAERRVGVQLGVARPCLRHPPHILL